MQKTCTASRKLSIPILASLLVLTFLPNSSNAATTFVNMCVNESYTMSASSFVQWQSSIYVDPKGWTNYFDIPGATNIVYTFSPSSEGNTRIR